MTQYKLLKDLPEHIAGVVFEEDWDGTPKSSSLNYLMRDFPAWFEPVLPQPPAKETYVLKMYHFDGDLLLHNKLDLTPDAADKVAKAIEALLAYLNMPEQDSMDLERKLFLDLDYPLGQARAAIIQAGSAA